MIDLTNVINVTLSSVPKGLPEYAVNNVAIFTNETVLFADTYRVYKNAKEVATDCGSSSLAAQMATAIFSQTPNILSGNGSLYIVPTTATNATAGKFVSADLSANVSNFISIADGALKLKLNGVDVLLNNLNFTRCTTLQDIVNVIDAAIINADVSLTSNKITIQSRKFGTTSTVTLAAGTGGTDISIANLVNIAGGISTAGTASSDEKLRDAVNRISDKIFFTGLMTTQDIEEAEIILNAKAIQALDKEYMLPLATSESIDWFNINITGATLTKTRGFLYLDTVLNAKLAMASYMGRGFCVNFNGSKTLHTMHLKELVGVTTDPNINQTLLTQAIGAGIDVYVNVAGVACLLTSGLNGYFDEIHSNIWCKLALEVAGFNYLKQTNTKVPQTEVGMDGLKGAYNKILNTAINNGLIGKGLSWNSSVTFGDPVDFKNMITQQGYYTYSLPIAQQAQTEREARKAPLIQIAFKRAGAIHSSDVLVIIER